MRAFLTMLVCLPWLFLPVGAAKAAWEKAEFTVAPLYEGVPMEAQFRYSLGLDFSPGPRSRVIRFKGAGLFASYTSEEMKAVAQGLLSKLDNLDALRLPGSRPERPVYFANSRLFLVSVKPAVMAIVPHSFMPPGSAYTTATLYQLKPDMLYHNLFEKQRVEHHLRVFPARLDEPLWINYVELSAVIPDVPGTRVIGELWETPVALESALQDPRWPFQVLPSQRYPAFLEFTGRSPAVK